MQEEWREIDEFSNYLISDTGQVLNEWTNRLITPRQNQQHVSMVTMGRDGRQLTRSVALLVARAFLPDPQDNFDTPTPINLDGDRGNNHVDNLAWRPRWFAIEYHKQFTQVNQAWLDMPIELITTDEFFKHTIDCCIKYGLLVRRVVLAAHNGGAVYPHGFEFNLIKS